MIFKKHLPSKKVGKHYRSMGIFECPVCGEEVTKMLSNGERDRTCGKQDCKNFNRYMNGTNHSVTVEQLNDKGEVVREFPSIAQAGRVISAKKMAIDRAIEKKKEYKGFFWRKKNDIQETSSE